MITKYRGLAQDERARLIEVQDLLLARICERHDAILQGNASLAKALEEEIQELREEKESIKKWVTVGSA